MHVFWELRLATHPMAEIMTDMAYADLVGGTQAMFEARAPLREVRIPGIAPQSLGAHQEISAGATLTFGAPRLEVIYDLGFLDWEMPHADELLHGYFEERARELRERLPQGTRDVTHRVRELVRARLIGGPPELDEIAGVLGASVRTVQRWLSGEGGSYGKVVEETRRELACVHLRAGKLSVAEISWMLGFSEPRAFHRAFKRWMTQTPGTYRKANLQKKTSEPDVQA